VGEFEYDALGRLASAQMRLDTDVYSDNQELPYFHDGQNVIAEVSPADDVQRRYIHRTTCIDERAIMVSTPDDPTTVDTCYYVLKELYAVARLIKRNGALVEANTYDAVGTMSGARRARPRARPARCSLTTICRSLPASREGQEPHMVRRGGTGQPGAVRL